jgi:serine protease Do
MFLLHTSGFAQEEANPENDTDKGSRYDEIIIRHKGDKDAKVTVEIKDGQVLVDGKPVSDFEDSTISIHRRKMRTSGDVGAFSFSAPDGSDFLSPGNFDGQAMAHDFSPFRNDGAFGYSGDDIRPRSNRSFLGVTSEKPSDGEGARVINVSKGSAAEKSGLRSGDVITKVDDMYVRDPQSLTAAVRQHQPGEKIAITFSRDGKVQKDSVVLGKARAVQSYGYGYRAPDLGQFQPDLSGLQQLQEMPREFNLAFNNPLKFGIRAQDTEDGKGVKVLDVDDESTAAKAGIKEGDIITRFDGKEINSATALTEAARAAREKGSVKITLIRDGKTQEVEVHVPKRLRTADL